MASSIIAELLQRYAAESRDLINASVDIGTNPDGFAEKVNSVVSVAGQALQTLMVTVEEMRETVHTAKESSRKPLGESKCISSLRTLGSDKSEFKNWNDKFVNAIAQVLGSPWRKFLRNLNRELDQNRKLLTKQELGHIDGATEVVEGSRANEDLYYVLVEKTEGEAALRVSSSEPGDGLESYQKVYLWFAGTTGLALAERTRMLMGPEPPKREEDIAESLEKWCEQERLLQAHGEDYRLSAAFKVTALRVLMTCRREQFELMEREAKMQHNDRVNDDMFKDLLNKVREYAARRRLEANFKKQKGDPMDVGEINQHENQLNDEWDMNQYDSLDALGKGKAKGKGW